jgi:hypothetical protein
MNLVYSPSIQNIKQLPWSDLKPKLCVKCSPVADIPEVCVWPFHTPAIEGLSRLQCSKPNPTALLL